MISLFENKMRRSVSEKDSPDLPFYMEEHKSLIRQFSSGGGREGGKQGVVTLG